MRRTLITAHRWLSLCCALFWLVQGLTGALIAFHWEARDATYPGAHHATDIEAIGARIAAIEGGGKATVESLWTTAGFADRYTLFLSDGGSLDVAGDGTVLTPSHEGFVAFLDGLINLHHGLLAGDSGEWIVGVSGAILAVNLVLALWIAWPRRGMWRGALRPRRSAGRKARLYGLHRAIGLWAAAPALVIVVTGTMLRFEDGTARLIGYQAPQPPAIARNGAAVIPFAPAVTAALGAIPGSTLVSVTMPDAHDALYRLRVREPGELARAYGTSRVVVDGRGGAVIAVMPASRASTRGALMDALFAVHTGEAGGIVGRVLAALLGLWLAVMVVLGTMLWQARRMRAPTGS